MILDEPAHGILEHCKFGIHRGLTLPACHFATSNRVFHLRRSLAEPTHFVKTPDANALMSLLPLIPGPMRDEVGAVA
jgi:hypothetical protein